MTRLRYLAGLGLALLWVAVEALEWMLIVAMLAVCFVVGAMLAAGEAVRDAFRRANVKG